MTLIRIFQDPMQDPRKRKRCIIACEKCGAEKEAQYKYYLETERKQIKYCKPCKEHTLAHDFMNEHNQNQPLSKCLELIKEDGTLMGLFECQSCGKIRKRVHSSKAYTQYCNKCSREEIGKNQRTHAIVRHDDRLARIFRNMKDRCYRPQQEGYEYYGGRGVIICQEWLDDRTKFYDWALANGYEEHLQIDKDKICIEQDINPPIYSPNTCTWMTRDENNLYKRARN